MQSIDFSLPRFGRVTDLAEKIVKIVCRLLVGRIVKAKQGTYHFNKLNNFSNYFARNFSMLFIFPQSNFGWGIDLQECN